MKNIFATLILSLFLTISINESFAQVILRKFQFTDSYLPTELESFKFKLIEELNKSYFIYEHEIGDILDEEEISNVRDYFRKKMKLQFDPPSYLLYCKIDRINPDCNYYNIYITRDEVETRKQIIIQAYSIPAENLTKVAAAVASIISYATPSIYNITSLIDSERFVINYGEDRGAFAGKLLYVCGVLESGDVIPIGEAEIERSKNQISYAKVINYDSEDNKVSLRNLKKFFVQSRIDKNLEKEYRNRLGKLSEKPECEPTLPNSPWHEATNITTNVFYYNIDEFKKFFNKTAFTPYIFGLEWTIVPSKYLGVFIDARTSLYSSVYQSDNTLGSVKSKFMFYQYGGGFKLNLPTSNFFFPGVGLSVKYHSIVLKKSNSNEEIVFDENIKGISAELKAFASLRLYDYFGLYGEVCYNFYPELKSNYREVSANALSFGIGVSIFIKAN